MYIRRVITRKGPELKEYCTYKLVESYKTEKGSRQRVLANLGAHFSLPESKWKEFCCCMKDMLEEREVLCPYPDKIVKRAEKLVSRILAQSSSSSSSKYVSIQPESLEVSQGESVGGESLCLGMIEELGLDQFFVRRGIGVKDTNLILGHLVGRLLFPGSDRSTLDWLQESSSLGELLDMEYLDVSLSSFYRSSDKLFEHKDALESYLYKQESRLFQLEETLVLYDLTNTFLEGSGKKNPKARRGRSKEKRSDCPLLSLGIVLDAQGFPKRSQFFEGNVSEPSSLQGVLKELSPRQGSFEKKTVLLDAGIATEENLTWLKSNHYEYLVVSRSRSSMPEEGELVSLRKKEDDGKPHKPPVWGKLVEDQEKEEWKLYCRSEAKVEKEKAIKTLFQERLEEDLEKLHQGLKKPRTLKNYEKVLERVGRIREKYKKVSHLYEIEVLADEKKEKATQIQYSLLSQREEGCYNGVYCLRTNQKQPQADHLWQTYTLLTEVESTFRCLKTELKIRPVFHQKESRCDAHLFFGLLAYHIVASIRFRLKQAGIHWSWDTIRQVMSSQLRVTVSMLQEDGNTLFIRKTGKPSAAAKKIYQALGYRQQRGRTLRYTSKGGDRMETG